MEILSKIVDYKFRGESTYPKWINVQFSIGGINCVTFFINYFK